jgi:Flp pilus assembly protein TadG
MLTRRRGRGQGLVEFALVFPVLVLVFFGTIDGARLLYTNSQLSQAAREGARVAAVEAYWIGSNDPACVSAQSQITAANPGAHVCPVDSATLKADVVRAANSVVALGGAIVNVYLACDDGGSSDPAPTGAWDETTVTFPKCDSSGVMVPNARGELVSVRVVYEFVPITPVAGQAIGSVSLSASTTMAIQ